MNKATDDLISRTVLIDELMAGCMPLDLPGLSGVTGDELTIRDYIDSAPAVDAAPVVHGRWKDNGNGTVSCNCCATWFPKTRQSQLLFCGYCGAKMED